MIERSIVIDDWLRIFDAVLLSDGVVGNGLAAEWYESRNIVRINFIPGKIFFIKSDHHAQIGTRRMPGDENQFVATAVLWHVFESPGYCCSSVFDVGWRL